MAFLTKSNYLWGLQCPKFLWITKNDKESIPEPDAAAKQKFAEGHIVGELATKVFPKGIKIPTEDFDETIERTKEFLSERVPLFEASFEAGSLYLRADILVPAGKDEWDIIEVKSGTKVKDIHLHDVSFQKYVCEKAGLKIRKCFLMHINNEYVRKGEIEPGELFVQTDITDKVEEFSKGIEDRIKEMLSIINSKKCPEFSVDDLLTTEYDNIVKDEFFDSLPKNSIFDLYRMRKKQAVELYKEGIVKMKDIPNDIKLNAKQKIQFDSSKKNKTHIDEKRVKDFIEGLKYPIHYLDFETINPPIPKFDGMKPYQRIPFQFSLHIQDKPNGKLKHVSFLAEGVSDPRLKFIQALKDNLCEEGSILVYYQSFEKGVMNEVSDALPEFKEWYEKNILPRIVDLWDVFGGFMYYNPKQNGSTSIKAILPLLSKLKYDDLDIRNGALASLEYERVTFGDVSENERKKVCDALEEYCALDTMAEVKIIEGLNNIVN